MGSGSVRVGDLGMFYLDVGEGEPVVLIMGYGGDHTAWALQMSALSARHRVKQDRKSVV